MDFFTYTLTGLVSFLGLFVGLLFAKFAPDEVHILKKFIPDIQLLLIILGFLVMFIYFPIFIASLIFIISFLFILFFWKKRDINVLDYIIFSFLFSLASLVTRAHYYMTAIIFVFGIFAGTLFFVLHDRPRLGGAKRGHHKHSGKHLDFDTMAGIVLKKYGFFVILIIINYIISNLFYIFI